jgi:hypothetical protein
LETVIVKEKAEHTEEMDALKISLQSQANQEELDAKTEEAEK